MTCKYFVIQERREREIGGGREVETEGREGVWGGGNRNKQAINEQKQNTKTVKDRTKYNQINT